MSDTPKTDAVEFYAGDLDGGQEAVPADFARQLERELAFSDTNWQSLVERAEKSEHALVVALKERNQQERFKWKANQRADTALAQCDYDNLVRDAMKWRKHQIKTAAPSLFGMHIGPFVLGYVNGQLYVGHENGEGGTFTEAQLLPYIEEFFREEF